MHQYYAKQHSEIATPCGMNPVLTTYLTYGLKARKHRTNSYKHLMNPNVVVVVPKVLRNVVEISVLHCEQFKLFSLYFYITVSLLYVVICFTLCLKRNVCYLWYIITGTQNSEWDKSGVSREEAESQRMPLCTEKQARASKYINPLMPPAAIHTARTLCLFLDLVPQDEPGVYMIRL